MTDDTPAYPQFITYLGQSHTLNVSLLAGAIKVPVG